MGLFRRRRSKPAPVDAAGQVPALPSNGDGRSSNTRPFQDRTGRSRTGGGQREILDYISTSGLDGKVHVSPEGIIHALQEVDRRLIRGLLSVVGRWMERDGHAGGDGNMPDVRWVSPIELDRLIEADESRNRSRRSGSRQAEEDIEAHGTVGYVLSEAIRKNASDIYLDIRRDRGRLSYRIYGQVQVISEMNRDQAISVARGLFNFSGTSKFQEKMPCDTAFSYQHEGKLYRVRANSLPDSRGQTLSCRVRDPELVLPLDDSGYSAHQIGLIERICRSPGGLILITGETNSGKSTTLAGLMNNSPRGERMIEIADPVEVEMDHCTHVEIDRFRDDAEEYFLAVLAATVRQNPDSLVLGEIRDENTAKAAESMAIQGKRVLSTLHTQSCVSAIPRLQNLGVDRHLLPLPEFIAGIVNQSLVPVVCSHCGLPEHPDPERNRYWRRLFPHDDLRFIDEGGCDRCIVGVTGQTLCAEVFPLSLDPGTAHQMIAREEYWKLAEYMKREHGVESKQDHARSKVRGGLIDPERTEAIIGEFMQQEARSQEHGPGTVVIPESLDEHRNRRMDA